MTHPQKPSAGALLPAVRAGELRTRPGLVAWALLACVAPAGTVAGAEPLRIAFISYANPQKVIQDSKPITAYLEKTTGLTVQGFVSLDYGSSIEAMRGGKADLAFVDPLAFLLAHKEIGAVPLLLEVYHSGKPTYHSCIWVRRDSGIKTPEDLRGKTVAFADPVDMSGYLLPRHIFERKGLVTGLRPDGGFFKQVYFAGGDEQAMRSVLNKFVDAAGLSEYGYLLLRPDERDQIVSIATSIESPSHVVMARKDLPASTMESVKKALLALQYDDPSDRAILDKLYGIRGYVPAKLGDFAPVAPIARQHGFIQDIRPFTRKEDKP